MKITVSFSFILVLSLFGFAQQKNDEMRVTIGNQTQMLKAQYSSVYDIRRFVKYCVETGIQSDRKSGEIIAQFLLTEQSIKFDKNCDEAEFRINYSEQNNLSEMRVFYIMDKTVWIVWTENLTMKKAEQELAGEFLKVLQRNKNLDPKPALTNADG